MTTPNPYNWTTHTPVVNHYDPDMDAHPHISHFGALKTSPVYPIAKGNFPGTALDVALWSSQTLNGGNISVAKGVAAVKTSTNAAGSVKLLARQDDIEKSYAACFTRLSAVEKRATPTLMDLIREALGLKKGA